MTADVGVLTFHRASNYGAVLQAWALQEVLRRLGARAEVVDYRSPSIEAHYRPDGWRTVMSARKIGIALLRNGYHLDRRAIFQSFVDAEIPVSRLVYERDQLHNADAAYKRFIVGSDQVWNYQTAGFDRAYFLDFVTGTGRRAAYGASIGLDRIPEEYRSEYARLLTAFSHVTVREDAGARLVEELIGRRPRVVLDPTLLLDRSGWEQLASRGEQRSRPFILVYLLAETPKILAYARSLGAARDLDVIYLSQRLFRPHGIRVHSRATPYDFVRLMSDADAIVTNSFHGMAFALNFCGDLHFDLLPEPARVNSRLESLADRFGLWDRRIPSAGLLSARSADARAASLHALKVERSQSLVQLASMIKEPSCNP